MKTDDLLDALGEADPAYAISEHAGSILCRWLPVWHFF